MFNIRFINESFSEEEISENSSFTEIVIDDFRERFLSSHDYWDRQDYIKQWREGLQRIISGESQSILITNMYDPLKANYIFTWLIYVVNKKVILQNKMLLIKELKLPFNEKNPYASIQAKETMTEDGDEISEWETNLGSIKEFYHSLI